MSGLVAALGSLCLYAFRPASGAASHFVPYFDRVLNVIPILINGEERNRKEEEHIECNIINTKKAAAKKEWGFGNGTD